MKNNKMTPGPWVANGLTVSTANKMPAQIGNRDPRHIDVAIAYYDHEEADLCKLWNYDEACANADAIAALPELVNVALELVEYGQQTGWGDLALCGSGDKSIDDKAESIMRNARLALEKAGVL